MPEEVKPHQNGKAFFHAVQEAVEYGHQGGRLILTAEEFDAAMTHVAQLLSDALEAYRRGSNGTSVFLSITAIEETAKAEIIGFRANAERGRGRDPLRSHSKKHLIAIRPTTFMGKLPKILGDETCARLQAEAENGDLVALREQAIYVHYDNNGLTTPAETVSSQRAREILLLALEAADDGLVGWTNKSFRIGNWFEQWIAEVSEPRNE